ncbi:MAG: VOC family protein [Caldimonas sp.]
MSVEPARALPRFTPDHLVVAARTLDEGAAWCEATLGVVPAAGGKHPTMATHNRLVAVSSPRFARMYLEIIAIDPDAPVPVPARARWFDLDSPELQQAIATSPRLVHWAVRTDDIDAGIVVLRAAGHELGTAIAAERMTPRGMLRWRIALRADGRRLASGAVPLLIEWGDVHPCDALPESGVRVEQVTIAGVSDSLAASLGVSAAPAVAAPLVVALATPRGRVELVVA